jgi:hypothetical protein
MAPLSPTCGGLGLTRQLHNRQWLNRDHDWPQTNSAEISCTLMAVEIRTGIKKRSGEKQG